MGISNGIVTSRGRHVKLHAVGIIGRGSSRKRSFCFMIGNRPVFTGNTGFVPSSTLLPGVARRHCHRLFGSIGSTGVGVVHM